MLTKHQRRQLAQINAEFEKMCIGTQCNMESDKNFPDVCVVLKYDTDHSTWRDVIRGAQKDSRRFGVKKSSDYIIEMLRRVGIFGVAVCSPRDEPDSEFGTFVAKARLLKHIKSLEHIEKELPQKSHSTEV